MQVGEQLYELRSKYAAGWWFGIWILFSIIYGMSSFPLTFIFFKMVKTTNQAAWRTTNRDTADHGLELFRRTRRLLGGETSVSERTSGLQGWNWTCWKNGRRQATEEQDKSAKGKWEHDIQGILDIERPMHEKRLLLPDVINWYKLAHKPNYCSYIM